MTTPDRSPVRDPDGVPWNAGGWFGTQVGGTAWMLTAGAVTVGPAPWVGLLFFLSFAAINAGGVWVWRHRERFRLFRAAQAITLVSVGLALLVLLALTTLPPGPWKRALDGPGDGAPLRGDSLKLLLMVAGLLVLFEVQGRRARRVAQTASGHPPSESTRPDPRRSGTSVRNSRLTVRRLMLAVAILAILFWSTILAWRSLEYRRLASHHESIGRTLSGEIFSLSEDAEAARKRGADPSSLEAQILMRREALVEEQRAAALFRQRTWQPWKTVRYRGAAGTPP